MCQDKNKNIRGNKILLKKRGIKMAIVLQKDTASCDLSKFMKANKSKLYDSARKSTKYNSQGKAVISKNDDWFDENIWDEHFERNKDK